jgi:hypothetical protein
MKQKRKSRQVQRRVSVSRACSTWLENAMRNVRRRQAERSRKAGKHVCIPECSGTMNRVTGRKDRILKRPVVVRQFHECKICGRDMTPNVVLSGNGEREKKHD